MAMQYEVFECFPLLTASHTHLSCLFSLSTTPLTLDLRCNPPLSFLFWIFCISLRSSSSPILPPLPLLLFLWFLSLYFFLFLILLFVPNSYIFWGFPTIKFSYFSYCLPVFILAPHYFLFLSFLGIEACSSIAILDFICCLFLSLLLLLLVQPTLVLSRFFSLQCFLLFCNLSISSPFMSITSALCRALDSTTPFQYVFPIITRWQLFSTTEFVITLNLLIFIYHFVLLSFKHISLCLYTITPK